MDYLKIEEIARTQHPNKIQRNLQYGTAGFRMRAHLLDHLMYRMGILAVLRSKSTGAAIGLMITASHNEEADNGVKLVDPNGEMLETAWETIATRLANVKDTELITTLKNIVKEQNINENATATVIIGRDTRQSGQALLTSTVHGIEAANGIVRDFGIITTPELHYLVVCTNTNGGYGEASVEGYLAKLSKAFARTRNEKIIGLYKGELYLDAANGVGAIAAKEFAKRLNNILTINVFNDGTGELNHECGADYVKIRQIHPINSPITPNVRCASIDGDADRIVYYYTDDKHKFHLLDGDKIATLAASYLKELIEASDLDIQLGLVQTAYANGASTSYISDLLKIPVACTSTGVKHLHHRAQEFDIGVYFEANGHGTIIFKETTVKMIRQTAESVSLSEDRKAAAAKLQDLIDIINQTVGDALSDMLLVETILHAKGWDIITWERSYTDFPNRQLKVQVKDRNVIKTTDAERKCTSPVGLQDKIDELVSHYHKGRSFVRPSGTEDIVRVYAECANPAEVDKLAAQVALAVYKHAGGIGPEPICP